MNYAQSGVNIDIGTEFTKQISKLTANTHTDRIISSIGGFNAQFDISNLPIKNPVLVSSTDGVGTKLKLAQRYNRFEAIGIDLVAMCVNDVIVSGATPLFFLDYYATGKLDTQIGQRIISGIVDGCLQSNMSLVGGETAEMPLCYDDQDFDLAGFCVGIVDRDQIISSCRVKRNDVIIGVASSGPHSNGYSLINSLITDNNVSSTIIDQLLAPTKIYVNAIKALVNQVYVHGIAHITGGGITENLPRILPNGLSAIIEPECRGWSVPPIFNVIKSLGAIDDDEMLRVFNCGVGMIVIVDQKDVDQTISVIMRAGEKAFVIGNIAELSSAPQVIYQ